jgi:type 1 glutamine amidotransferase
MPRLRIVHGIAFAAAVALLAARPSAANAADEAQPRRLLFYHRSAGFQHSVVEVKDGQPCYAETVLRPLCEKHNWELTSTKDGDIFTPENIAKFDAFLFYTTGDLTAEESADGSKPMPKEAKEALLKAIEGGKGFVGFHCASDTFHSPGPGNQTQSMDERDPYIRMIGGEFVTHGSQQETTMTVCDHDFGGLKALGNGFDKHEEWYSLKNFAPDMHVLLINETRDMEEPAYKRPPYPATWLRMHGDGRVFYTSMGHREDVWTSPEFETVVVSGITWALGDAEADASPNIDDVTPEANTLGE